MCHTRAFIRNVWKVCVGACTKTVLSSSQRISGGCNLSLLNHTSAKLKSELPAYPRDPIYVQWPTTSKIHFVSMASQKVSGLLSSSTVWSSHFIYLYWKLMLLYKNSEWCWTWWRKKKKTQNQIKDRGCVPEDWRPSPNYLWAWKHCWLGASIMTCFRWQGQYCHIELLELG